MRTERVITVEYLQPTMSLDLLGKFPDESRFGFDYSQSGIWSPLLPRGRLHLGSSVKLGKFITSKKKKKHQQLGNTSKKLKQSASKKRLQFSPVASPRAGWNRILRAAAKRFKVQGRSPLQMLLPAV